MTIKLTAEQQLIIDADGKVIKVVAFAGTGKTFTLIQRAIKHVKRSVYLAFNKSVQVEAESKFPKHVTCITGHALAFRAVMGRGSKYRLADYGGNLSMFSINKTFRLDYYMASLVKQTVENFCASADPDITSVHVEPDWMGKYQYDIGPVVLDTARKVWTIMVAGNDHRFLMTHSGYLKIFQLSKPRLGYEVIMLDEAQDTNPVVHDIVFSQSQYGSQIILVGDPYQQIYSWRGAVDAMDKIECETFYLTQSFRFGNEVAGVANHILNAFFAEERPLQGLGSNGQIATTAPVGPYTFLARTNAFLFAKASTLAGKAKMFVPGRDNYGNLPIFNTINDIFAMYQGGDWRKAVKQAELKHFQDYQELLEFCTTGMADPEWNVSVAMVEKYKDGIPAQIQAIKASLVSRPQDADVTLITAHRAKGLEWDQVVLEDDYAEMFDDNGELRRFGDCRKTQIQPDEVNLLYVAATRAKRRLTINTQLCQLLTFRKAMGTVSTAPATEAFTMERDVVNSAIEADEDEAMAQAAMAKAESADVPF
jgi:F-box protein 18 (helicase)